ncbi:FkbM family methyltransferase [Algoriphagus sp. D3-2-R+10]|uniref:FkbM family methyltransferase n=1 Tax=Algoriphagus aurantiacus TaxID=3103948 RepID=UPI002B384E09|nr:FkbM family methyltransferase [Algoriphagus sp. D3-2-R+10]MEB2778323.1 FkbM family methyltransferase [Algoriphagus sp. D3-2-R+10]
MKGYGIDNGMKNYYSQHRQDEFLDQVIFHKKENGFFIDIGAHDGISFSNTYFLERKRKWKGICFEPNPKVFLQLVENRNSINENCCVGTANGEVLFWQISGYSEMLSGMKSSFDDKHISRIEKELKEKGGSLLEIKVPVRELSSYDLIMNNKVNYLSIDTEGNEFDILKSIDFKINRIEVISVENNYQDINISSYLIDFGYKKVIKIGCDEIYILSELLTLSVKFRIFSWRVFQKIKRYTKK